MRVYRSNISLSVRNLTGELQDRYWAVRRLAIAAGRIATFGDIISDVLMVIVLYGIEEHRIDASTLLPILFMPWILMLIL